MRPISADQVRDLRERTGMGLMEARRHIAIQRILSDLGSRWRWIFNLRTILIEIVQISNSDLR
jgi:hypothetical protein